MKTLIILISTVLLFSCGQENKENKQVDVKMPTKNHIAIYDFHTDHRCETCIAIEAAARETLNKNFKSQLNDSTITFTLINADSEENQAVAEEYGAFGTTLAITIIKDGKKEIMDITNWAFDAVHGDNFENELTDKLNNALTKL